MRTYHHNREKEELHDQIRNSEVNLRILAELEPKWRYNLPKRMEAEGGTAEGPVGWPFQSLSTEKLKQ